MKPNDVAGSAINILGAGLDRHIGTVMKPVIGELEWPAVLRELDALKGKVGYIYSRSDVALQLRMVTERLGNLAYPFDSGDHNRTMSSYGGILRIYRKRWAHNDEFTHFEAAHLIDTVRIVMAHIGDHVRAAEVAQLHASLVQELTSDGAEPSTLGETAPSLRSEELVSCGNMLPREPADITWPNFESEVELEMYRRGLQGIRTVGHLAAWEPWEVTLMGEPDVLDTMRTKSAKERVRAVIEDIVDAEAPIQIERLAKLVGYAFGLGRVQTDRVRKITYQVKNSLVVIDSDGFVWPENVDSERWLLYRSSSEKERKIEQVSPVELANAAVDLLKKSGSMAKDALGREVLASFGRSRSSKQAEAQLAKGLAQAKTFGRITEVDGVCHLVQATASLETLGA